MQSVVSPKEVTLQYTIKVFEKAVGFEPTVGVLYGVTGSTPL